MDIRTIGVADAMLMKAVRLRSLADAPYAFGGPQAYGEEAVLPDAHWEQLAAELDGRVPAWKDRCLGLLAMDGDEAVGTAGSYLCPRVPGRAYFSAAWVDPRHRRRGVGRALVDAAKAWATSRGADHLVLWVEDGNPAAARFYEAIGFRANGDGRPVSPGSEAREGSFELRLSAAG